MNIYISGSISKNPNYKEQFVAAEYKLNAAGHCVINPARNTGNSYKEYIDKGLAQEMKCDAIYMLSGYEESTGAMLELQYAKAVEMKIMFEQEEKTMNKKTIEITIEEYSRLKDIETRFEILKNQAMNDEFCAKHTQVVLGIEHSYEAKQKQAKKELNADMFPGK